MKTHLQIVGILYIVFGAMFVFTGLAALLLLGGIGLVTGELQAFAILGWIGTFGLLFFGVLGLPGIVVGRMLLAHERGARIPAIVLAIFLAFSPPAGTLVAAYILWVLFDTEVRAVLGDPVQRTPATA